MPFKPRAWVRWRDSTPRRKPVGLQRTAQPSLVWLWDSKKVRCTWELVSSRLESSVSQKTLERKPVWLRSHPQLLQKAGPYEYVPYMEISMGKTTVMQCLQRLDTIVHFHKCQKQFTQQKSQLKIWKLFCSMQKQNQANIKLHLEENTFSICHPSCLKSLSCRACRECQHIF